MGVLKFPKRPSKQLFHEIIGITDSGEIYMLRYVFDHGNGFQGAVGTVFIPITQDQIDERNDLETVKDMWGYMWQEAVQDGRTTDSLDEYCQGLIDCAEWGDGEFLGHDTSYIDKIPESFREQYFPDAITFECVGGGRCFDRGMQWESILKPELIELIYSYEGVD